MAISYRETFKVPGLGKLGIEDYEQEGDHFFPHDYPGRRKRFALWCGGGGFGQADTIEEARTAVQEYIIMRLTHQITEYSQKLAEQMVARDAIKDDVFNLGMYKTRE